MLWQGWGNLDYIAIHVKIRKDGKELDHWSDLDVEELKQLAKMVQDLEQAIDITIFEKDHTKFIEETA